jgi:hypothetical protein
LIATLCRGEEGALSDVLAGLPGRLRGRPDGRPCEAPGEPLDADADRFVRRLAEHLRYSEETPFPALRKVDPGSACDIKGLKEDHRLFHRCARDLALLIRGGHKERACGDGRSLLAALPDPINRETQGVDRLALSLDVLDAQSLSRAFAKRRPAAGRGDFQDPPP